jgi:glycosyltransferase 2 family protein
MQLSFSYIKVFLRWMVVGGTLFFLAKAFSDHWAEVKSTTLQPWGFSWIVIALCLTLLGHTWAGYVWGLILHSLNQKAQAGWAIQVYLRTNIAKYLPGNVWHYYGRISAAKNKNISFSAATMSVIIESLLMATSALLIALIGSQSLWSELPPAIQKASLIAILGLGVGLLAVHPSFFNWVMKRGRKIKSTFTKEANAEDSFAIAHYPFRPLLGELIFLGLRATGFIFTVLAFHPLPLSQLPLVYTVFSLAWFLGLVVPGAPGGIGVFESAALTLLKPVLPGGVILSSVALYRLISISAEAIGAGLATLSANGYSKR